MTEIVQQNLFVPSRIIFNFTEKCNLNCRFCYVPFDGTTGNLEVWEGIVQRCKEWHPKLITFGGGDPFLYQDFRQLVTKVADSSIFIHVDTNALALHPNDVPLIKQYINQIGLPLDGNQTHHTIMRGNPKHFANVIKWLARLSDQHIQIKINTVVTRLNGSSLDSLARLLSNFPIRQWCLYQFWPLAQGNYYQQNYNLSEEEFYQTALPIKEQYSFTNIDVSSINSRAHSHFFVTHSGLVYSERKNNHYDYAVLGTIFDKDILEKWRIHTNQQLIEQRTRLRLHPGTNSELLSFQ